MLKRLSFRSKLLLVLFVPFLALVVVAAAGLNDRFDALRAHEQFGKIGTPIRALDALSRALENEAVVSSWFLADPDAVQVAIRTAREKTDAAVKAFRANQQALLDAGVGGAARAALERTNASLGQLTSERLEIDGLNGDPAQARGFYLDADSDVLGIGEGVAYTLRDPETAASLSRLSALQRVEHEVAREAAIEIAVRAGGAPVPTSGEQLTGWISSIAAQRREQAQFFSGASPAEVSALTRVTGEAPPDGDLPTAFPATGGSPDRVYQQYRDESRTLDKGILAVDAVLSESASARADAAQRDVLVYGGIAVLAMLITLALIWFVTRAVVRPVRTLTSAAREMSGRQLPQLVELLRVGGDVNTVEPTRVEVTSEDEIGELAQAFNDVQTVTMDVAREQSRLLRKGMGDLFVNLARRNQSLLERQLALLDELERNEHDPTALDALFKLDHMATRMRRNAESLLVLSGAEQPRQWQQPIALLDVVRAAAAEIADFPRVELVGIDDELAVAGRAVSDVAHLLAELLENATSFSPPDSAVVVSGAPIASGFVLAVSDQGIGVPADRLGEANELLARPPVVGLALSRALGLHVVGSLAARHGITVELRPGAPVGLVALVTLPSSVLDRTGAVVSPAEPVFAPDVGPNGEPAPLGARRVAWRPPDEPPVEEWRREGMTVSQEETDVQPNVGAAPAPVATEASPAPVNEVPVVEVPVVEVPVNEVPVVEVPVNEVPVDDVPVNEVPVDDAPLPTRIPGRHMSHSPTAEGGVPLPESDPLRPYRVHELLTRHDQGKRRGRAETDVLESDLPEPKDSAPEGER